MTLQWHHPLLDGGTDQTIHDAGKELFKHPENLVKEMCQNTNDAWAGGPPARIEFVRERHRPHEVPGLDDVLRRVRLCQRSQKECEESTRFLERAEEILTARSVDSLRISDYNTRGATGDDKTKNSPWYRLVRSAGGTSKRSGEGGSHGLGKIAAIAASAANTVYYSTLAEDGTHRFVATSLLASYEDEEGTGRQNRSFYGLQGGSTVHDPSIIPPMLLRKEQGLDALILAFQFKDEWTDETAAAILRFMWPAIHHGRFEAVVRDAKKEIKIDRDNLNGMLQRYSEHTKAHLYHAAYTNPLARHELHSPTIGKHSVHISVGPELNNRFALFRKNGIVIEERRVNSRVKVCGALECDDERGNDVLRRMEPPRHDLWDPKESDDPAEARLADREVRESIKKTIEKATIPQGATEGSVSGLENLLPMDAPIGGPPGKKGNARAKPRRTTPPPMNARIPTTTRNRTKTPMKIGRLVARAAGEDEGFYTLNIDHPTGIAKARIGIGIAGDSGGTNLAEIEDARHHDGTKITKTKNRLSFGPIELKKGTTQLQVKLKDQRRLSFEVYSIETPASKKK